MPGTWQTLTNQPASPVERMLLLTDGSILCHTGGADWIKYAPDDSGQYLSGSWIAVDRMRNARRNFGAVTLPDGRVMVLFGWPDYSSGRIDLDQADHSIEFFNPTERAGRQWSRLPARPGWAANFHAQTHCCLLSDGRKIIVGSDIWRGPFSDFGAGHQSSLYDIATNRWTLINAGTEGRGCDIQAWTLLPDGSVFATNCRPDFRYVPDAGTGRWVPAGSALYTDVYIPFEGAGILLPDGRVWVVSKIGNQSKFYTPPSAPGDPGSWSDGPDVPRAESRWETNYLRFAACVLPSGKVFFTGNHAFDAYPQFFEFDPSAAGEQITQTPQPDLERTINLANDGAVLLLLPTGQVMMSYQNRMFLYTPDPSDRAPQAAWRPRLSNPMDGNTLIPGAIITARGTLFNGITQAVAHNPWKSAGTATNFPIIRLTHRASGRVWYCRTYDHNSMGVATGSTPQFTHFKVPDDVPEGPADLCIIVNGIVGHCLQVTIGRTIREIIIPPEMVQLIGNLADGPLIVIGPHGPRPVPPFGPLINNEKAIRKRIMASYQHILMGLFQMNAATNYQQDEKNGATFVREEGLTEMGIQQIKHGLDMLRKIGDQLEQPPPIKQ